MSIFKHDHRDNVGTGLLATVRGWFGATCPSYLAEYQGQPHKCTLRLGHKPRHKDETTGLSWGYGDDWSGTAAPKPPPRSTAEDALEKAFNDLDAKE